MDLGRERNERVKNDSQASSITHSRAWWYHFSELGKAWGSAGLARSDLDKLHLRCSFKWRCPSREMVVQDWKSLGKSPWKSLARAVKAP